jgi:hypothetical protein
LRSVIVLCLLLPAIALADQDINREAKKHYDAGTELMQQKQWKRAVQELRVAYTLDPKPEIIYALAQATRLRGDCLGEVPLYKEYLQVKTLSEVQRGYATRSMDACKDVVAEQQMTLQGGDDGKKDDDTAARAEWDQERASRSSSRRTGWILAVTGVVVAGAGGVFLALEQQKYDQVKSGGLATIDDLNGAISTAHTFDTIAIGSFIAGGLLAGWGVIKVLSNGDPGGYHVHVVGSRGYWGVSLSGAL